MRIDQIDVNGFGALRDHTFKIDSDAPLTLFYGHNEAGKSTLMGLLRTVLFGFPTRSHMAQRYEPVNGGAHGGAITMLDEHGERIRIERYGGRDSINSRSRASAGLVQVTLEDGSRGGEEMLQSLLGGISSELFRSLFAFDLSELQEIRSLQSEEISSHLFNAGMSGGGGAIVQTERRLQQEMEQLYKPRGTKQELNRILKSIGESHTALRGNREHIGQYNQWIEELAGLDQRIESQEQQLREAREEWAWYDKCQQAREHWMRLMEMGKQLEELPQFPTFPEDALARFHVMHERKERLSDDVQRKEVQLEQLQQQLNDMIIDEGLLANRTKLDHLLEQVSLYQNGGIRVAELTMEWQNIDDQLTRLLKQIDPDWTSETLKSFPISIAAKEWVRQYLEHFTAYEAEQAHLLSEVSLGQQQQAAVEQTTGRLQQRLRELVQRGEAEFAWLKSKEPEQMRSLFSKLTSDVDLWRRGQMEIQHQRQRLEDIQKNEELIRLADEQRKAWGAEQRRQHQDAAKQSSAQLLRLLRMLVFFGVGINIALPLALQWFVQQPYVSIGSFLVIALLNGYIVRQWSKHNAPRFSTETDEDHEESLFGGQGRLTSELMKEMNLLEEGQQQLNIKLHESMNALIEDRDWYRESVDVMPQFFFGMGSLRGDPGKSYNWPIHFMNELQLALDQWLELAMEKKQIEGKLADEAGVLKVMKAQQEQWEASMQERQHAFIAVQSQWASWLEQQRLPSSLTTTAVLEIYQYVEQGLQLYRQREKIEAQLGVLREQLHLFEDSCIQLLDDDSIEDIVHSLKEYKAQVVQHDRLVENKLHKEQLIATTLDQLQEGYRQLERTEREIGSLWKEAWANDEAEFRLHTRQHLERGQLHQEQLHVGVWLENWVGLDRQEQLEEVLRGKDPLQLTAQMEAIQSQSATHEHMLNEMKDTRGRLRNELEKLKGDSDHADQLQLLEEQTSAFQQRSKRWAALALCAELFKQARAINERERQPGVLRLASEYFSVITDGQFRRVMAPLGEKRIMVERANGEHIDTVFLSRGTAEQLYLAMRFALANEYSKRLSLPLIMDDIFVNFDRPRLSNTLSVMKKMAEKHQIIVFTCHPHVNKAIAEVMPAYQCIEL